MFYLNLEQIFTQTALSSAIIKERAKRKIAIEFIDEKINPSYATILEAYGIRANYSVFELDISQKDFDDIKQKLAKLINHKTDKILFYRICRTCMAKSQSIGEGQIFSTPNTYI